MPNRVLIAIIVTLLSVLNVSLNPKSVLGDTSPIHQETVTGGSTGSATVSTSTNVTATIGDLYLASISTKSNVAVSTITGLGLSWTRLDSQCAADNRNGLEVWKAQGIAVTPSPVTATLSSIPLNATIAVSRYSNVDGINPVGTIVSANINGINGSCTGGTNTTTYDVSLVAQSQSLAYGSVAIGTRTHTPGAGFIERADFRNGSGSDKAGVAIEDKQVNTAGTVSVNGSLDQAAYWAVIALEIKAAGGPPQTIPGDADGDGDVDFSDLEIWENNYLLTTSNGATDGDFNLDGIVNGIDFDVWRSAYQSPTPTPAPTNSPLPSSLSSPSPRPTSPPVVGEGIWISQEEIETLPMSGEAWNNLKKRADSDIGTANIADQDSKHDINTLAVALVYARTKTESYRTKAVDALLAVIGTDENHDPDCPLSEPENRARSMAIGRNLSSYVIAADIINNADNNTRRVPLEWDDYVQFIRFKKNCTNTGASAPSLSISESHNNSGSNGSAMSGGSRIAAALYMEDQTELELAWQTYQRYSGDRSKCTAECSFEGGMSDASLSWSHDPDSPTMINPANTFKDGHRIGGAIVNDIARGGSFAWPPGVTGYPWEGLQGYSVQAELLYRAGYPAYTVQNEAPKRALDYLYFLAYGDGAGDGGFGEADWWLDTDYVKNLLNYRYGTQDIYPPTGPANGGKNMAWTDWTHVR